MHSLLLLLLQHGIELLLLIVIHNAAGLGNGGFAQHADFLDLVFARHRGVIHERHGLLVLIFQNVLQFGLLVSIEAEFLRKHLYLIVNRRATGLRRRGLLWLGRRRCSLGRSRCC